MIVLAIFFLIASSAESILSRYVANKELVPFAAVLAYALLDLSVRLLVSPSTFADQIFYLLPIPKRSYALQTVLLSFYSIINLASGLFLFIYLIFTTVRPDLESNLIFWFVLLILSNNTLALAIKRWRVAGIILFTAIVSIVLLPPRLLQDLIQLIYMPWVGVIYFLLITVVAGVVVYFTYPFEKAKNEQSSSNLFRFNLRLNDPLIWQEVLLIIRNKRPRGLILSYFILIPYFFFIFNDQLTIPDITSFAVLFMVLFLVAGVAIQYGYLGLAWENQHLEKLLSVTDFKHMIEAKYKILSYLNAIGLFCVLIICIWMPVILPVVLASWVLQQSWGNYMLIYYMIYNKKPFEINKSSFFNYDGISAAQMFLPLIILAVQLIVLVLCVTVFGGFYGSLAAIGIGIIGLYLRPKALAYIAVKWQENKYIIVHNFRK